MVSPVTVNLELYRNADYGEIFYFVGETGTALDFTGHTGALEVRRYEKEPGTALLTGSVDCTVGGGGIELTIARAGINALPAPATRGGQIILFYDLRLTQITGEKDVWMRGSVTVFGGVTTS